MKKFILLLLAVMMFGGCSRSILVQSEQIKPTDLNKLKTFRFIDESSNPNLSFNEATQERIKINISNELNARNFIESELADFEISILGGIEMVRQTGVRYNYMGSYPYYPYYRYPNTDAHPKNSDTSALIINIFDKGQLVWQGVATGDFKPRKKQHIEVAIAEIIKSIFEQFPYQSEL